jgi:hypothetical protein
MLTFESSIELVSMGRIRSNQIDNKLELVTSRRSWEQRLGLQHLSQNTTEAPYIYMMCVSSIRDEYLRSAIPSSGYVFSQTLFTVTERSCQAQVSYLDTTALVY